ncbi:DUF6415 family natural product biosynthesis protein [Streptomyces sp. NPDC093982]|uniref:DUF6415 family natural product biosynthesis protein n=1 Tax=Streptomyces sp. NPDC093982 TaxID=3155077 RepID=UPI003418545A
MRAVATWFLDQPTLPRHQTVAGCSQDFRSYLAQLIPQIIELTRHLQHSAGRGALTEAYKAQRHLEESEAAGLCGEVERVRRLATSVMSLSDHYTVLISVAMCLACGQPVRKGEAWLPYEQVIDFLPLLKEGDCLMRGFGRSPGLQVPASQTGCCRGLHRLTRHVLPRA